MKTRGVLILWATFLVLAFAASASAASFNYSGVLSDPTGITGTGEWQGSIGWEVTKAADDDFVLYSYTFTHQPHDASYIIFEVSRDIADSEIYDYTGATAQEEIRSFSDDGSNNQGMPGELYGVKFELDNNDRNPDGTLTSTITFKSTRLPVWGDFYARCGIDPSSYQGNNEWDASWNLGFLAADADDGLHLLVPDTAVVGGVIPEPASLILLGSGLAGLVGLRRKIR